MRNKKSIILLLFVILSISMLGGCLFGGTGASDPAEESAQTSTSSQPDDRAEASSGGSAGTEISEDGQYSSKDDVALYIKTYGHLPSNYVTKKDARKAGWEGGSLEEYFPGCSLGGDVFRNREGLLPNASGRTYYECDVDAEGRNSRGAKRIVYSNDGLIYFSDNHYKSFTQLYGDQPKEESETNADGAGRSDISEDGQYSSKDDVALYIKTYGHLPSNYVTKKDAREAGWEGGSLEEYFPGCSIGGDVFRNREGKLPKASGRTYYECDVDAEGRNSRGAKRIVYSNDGLIYFSNNHYKSFTLLYGKE